MDFPIRRKLALQAAAQAHRVMTECNINYGGAVDPILVAEKRYCEVRFMALPSLEGVYSPHPSPVIILGSQRPAGRRAFTCVHELGHHEFNHGARIDEFCQGNSQKGKDPDEFLADMFAAFLLMSQGSIRKALNTRRITPQKIEPIQIFRLASFFGVGYSTLIDHMVWTLRLISREHRKSLLRIQPKELKSQFGGTPQSEVVTVDEFWRDRAVDLEIGDIIVFNPNVIVEDGPRLIPKGTIYGLQTFKAVSKGYSRAFHKNMDWAVNIRVASKHYEGLARYRFLDDPEEYIQ